MRIPKAPEPSPPPAPPEERGTSSVEPSVALPSAEPKEGPAEQLFMDKRLLWGRDFSHRLRPPPELSRGTTYLFRIPKSIFLTLFSLSLLPLCFASATLSASLRCGASMEEAFEILGHSVEVAKTHLAEQYESAQVGVHVLIDPGAAQQKRSLMIRVLESNARAKQAAAAAQLSIAKAIGSERGEPIPIDSVIRWGISGFLAPILTYLLLGFFLTRFWLRRRYWESVESLERRERARQEANRLKLAGRS
ncbi:MAG: hypothetical protein VYD19_02080 [Myxococcota bacterium]|nr:hypothetical protein [Myxococcota bacterium]